MSSNKNNLNDNQRDTFSGKFGFILACIGSAIGMGNIWMFPWRVGKFGGAAFLIPYFLFVFILGTTGLIEEFALGRTTKRGALGALKAIFEEKNIPGAAVLGYIPVVGGAGIAIGYAVVVGWTLKYLVAALQGTLLNVNAGEYFGGFAGTMNAFPWHIAAVILTLLILARGVSQGIEKVNKIIMPAFFILFIILMIRSLTLTGAKAGIEYLLVPDWSYLAKPITWVMALGQAFFTVSLGGSGMVAYGSYIKDDVDIPSSAVNTAVFDTLGAMIAAFTIIPAVFAFGLDPTAGPPLLFISLPMVFQQMAFGHLFAIVFFIAIIFAAVSSLMNLVEIPTEAIIHRFNISRKKASVIMGIIMIAVGAPIVLDVNLLGKWMDACSIYILPLGAIITAIAFFWVYGMDRAREQINLGAKKPLGKWFNFVGKYVFVLVAIVVFVLGIIYGGIG